MAEIDPKQLEPGTQIATKSGTKLSIIIFIGEGVQGRVYEVDYGGVRKALKWYKDLGRDPEAFRKNLEEKVAKGTPSLALLWPEDVTLWKYGTFVYVMTLRPEG